MDTTKSDIFPCGCLKTPQNSYTSKTNPKPRCLWHKRKWSRDWERRRAHERKKVRSPTENVDTKLILWITKSLHRKALRIATKEGVSLNHFIADILAERIGREKE